MILNQCYSQSDLNLVFALKWTILKYYSKNCVVVAFKFTLKILVQAFGTVAGDDAMRLGQIPFSLLLSYRTCVFCFALFISLLIVA